ncbi:MAG TPA: hypothetical protein VK889_04490 [Solirubrobacterales bacterium]|nr:hypothetical protein [Solirubrobacterales bacterium]
MTTATETKGTKTMKRSAILSALAASAWLLAAALPASAAAAPELKVNVGPDPFNSANDVPARPLVPDEERTYYVHIENSGDAPTTTSPTGTITVAVEFPALIPISSVVDTSGLNLWSCGLSGDNLVATCTGPAFSLSIPPGKDVCAGNPGLGGPCPIKIVARAGEAKGNGTLRAEACGGGAAACDSLTHPMEVADFGDSFGIAPINQPGADTVPAIPGTSAFWAGSCDRASAPAFGDPIAAPGLGSIPSTVWAPAGENGAPLSANRAQVPAPSTTAHCIDLGDPSQYETTEPGIWFEAPDWRLPPAEQAGSHPDGSTTMAFRRNVAANTVDGAVDNIAVELPPGFVGNPGAIEKCTAEQFADEPPQCSPASQAGLIHLLIKARGFGAAGHGPNGNYRIYPIWNLEPRAGRAAEFGFAYASGEDAISVRLSAKARTNDDFGVTAFTGQIPAALTPLVQTVTLWGVPWDDDNDIWRAPAGISPSAFPNHPCTVQAGTYGNNYLRHSGFTPGCAQTYDPSWGEIQPFLSQETDCATDSVVTGYTDSYQHPGNYVADGSPNPGKLNLLSGDPDPADADWKTASTIQAEVTGCEKLPFNPSISLDPTGQGGAAVQSADSPAGLDVELEIPQNNSPGIAVPAVGSPQGVIDDYIDDALDYIRSDSGLATAHLKDTTVTLPEGMTLNPAAASGQGACTMAQIGVTDTNSPEPPAIRFNNAPVTCPDSSKVGEVAVETPLLDPADYPTGNVYLASQGDNPFRSDFAIYIAITSPDRGLIAKLAGKVSPDPATGRLTTTVVENPELPFDTFSLKFKGGPRAPLATPVTCGTHTSFNAFASHAQPNSPVTVNDPFCVSSSPAGGCPGT